MSQIYRDETNYRHSDGEGEGCCLDCRHGDTDCDGELLCGNPECLVRRATVSFRRSGPARVSTTKMRVDPWMVCDRFER